MPKISGYREFRSVHTTLVFKKTGAQISEKATALLKEVEEMIVERESRIRGLSKGMDASATAELLLQSQRSMRDFDFGEEDERGKGSRLKREMQSLQAEREDAARLRAVVNNIEGGREFDLTFEELEYYEF